MSGRPWTPRDLFLVRLMIDYSLDQFARAMGFPYATVVEWESGKRPIPTMRSSRPWSTTRLTALSEGG